MNILISELRFMSGEIRDNKEGKFKYKNRYWKWIDNNKDTIEVSIEVSRDNKIWRQPKGIELKIINYL